MDRKNLLPVVRTGSVSALLQGGGVREILLYIGGPFYLVWYLLLFVDLRKFGKTSVTGGIEGEN